MIMITREWKEQLFGGVGLWTLTRLVLVLNHKVYYCVVTDPRRVLFFVPSVM
jgi:hypothetical protein